MKLKERLPRRTTPRVSFVLDLSVHLSVDMQTNWDGNTSH